jgi:hypothetical protein
LEFGDIQRCDVEAMRFDAGAGAREGSGKNDGAAEGQGIGGMRFGGIDVNPFMACERSSVEPRAICKKRVAAQMRDGGFQMKTAGDGNGDDFIVARCKDGGELANAFGVAALGEADEELAADAKHVAAFESSGKRDVFELAKLGEGLGERRRLAAAGLCPERKDYGQFIEDNGGIFDEHGVGKIGLGRKRNNAGAQFAEEVFIGMVLPLGGGQINGFAIDERKFAMNDSWANGACDGSEHFNRESLHENNAMSGSVEGNEEAE